MSGATVLEEILRWKRHEVAREKERRPLAAVEEAARAAPPPRSLSAALESGTGLRIIAEVKRASPSRGVIRPDFDPVAVAGAYARAGAAAISVLTDARYFGGGVEHLAAVRGAVSEPLLRKDFIVEAYQVWEARAAGADAILLILAALGDTELRDLSALAAELGMEVLWEVHDAGELERLAPFEPRLVGVNNRDLRTFAVSLDTTRRLAPRVPAGALVVSESGFSRRQELLEMERWGVTAFLIGESLMRAADPGEALRRLIAAP